MEDKKTKYYVGLELKFFLDDFFCFSDHRRMNASFLLRSLQGMFPKKIFSYNQKKKKQKSL